MNGAAIGLEAKGGEARGAVGGGRETGDGRRETREAGIGEAGRQGGREEWAWRALELANIFPQG